MPLPGASNLLVHGMMQSARARGVHFFEIGSLEFGDARQQGIAAFKRSFGGVARPAMGGRRVLSRVKAAAADLAGAFAGKLRGRDASAGK
jgi:hypothetical protein